MKYFAIYLLIVNAIGFLLMLIDKRKAICRRWRIREKTLFLTAAIGGSIGSIMGMYTFRHKTKHLQFTLGMPAILIVQLILAFVFFTQFYPLR
jgi:uncharacterized membrane protein YsdA (DUF1294 family)